jgi:hypothetical protein
MIKKDYIQRHFEEFGHVLAQILSSKKRYDWEKVESEIKDATERFTELELKQIEDLSEDEFEKQILNHPTLSLEQRKILARLLFEKLAYYIVMEDDENLLNLRGRCLKLYHHMQDNFTENQFDLDVHYKLEFLRKM